MHREIIHIKDLAIGYGNHTILDNINISLIEGELTALIGLNGVGKSTFLRTIIGLQNKLNGKVLLEGSELHKFGVSKLAKKLSFVSTEIINVNHLSVFDLVSQGRYSYTAWHGKLTKTDKDKVFEAVELVGMSEYINKSITEISDGERQRIMIARALAQDTPVIILDEPTAYLDLKNKYEIIHLLHSLTREKNKAILFSSHDLNIVLKEADRLIVMREDDIESGAPEDLLMNGCIEELFTNSSIIFDEDRADFSIKRNFKETVGLKGEGKALIWTSNALNRAGFRMSIKEDTEKIVEIAEVDNQLKWILRASGKKEQYNSIYELIRSLSV